VFIHALLRCLHASASAGAAMRSARRNPRPGLDAPE
jgi:hypothetical protein